MVAQFWAAALGHQLADGADAVVLPGDITITGPRSSSSTRRQDAKRPRPPRLTARELIAGTERLQQLGATIVRDVSENANHWTTLADPEGNR